MAIADKIDVRYPVVEIFKSIEGEGKRTGEPTVFVRFAECNLNCSWCDTTYSHKTGEDTMWYTKEELAVEILKYNCFNVTFTGGEPLFRGINFINWFAHEFGEQFDINVETNGSVDIGKLMSNVWVTIDYKCPSSGMTEKMNLDNLLKLKKNDVLKFVVADERDLKEVIRIMMNYKPRCTVYVNPVFGKMDLQKLAKFVCDNHFLGIRMGLQIHKIIWDPNTRGV